MFLSTLPQTELGGKIVVFAVLLKDLFRRYLTGLAKLRRKSRTRHILKFIRLIASPSGYFAPYLRQICRRITRERQKRRPTVRCTERGCELIALRRLADDTNLTSRVSPSNRSTRICYRLPCKLLKFCRKLRQICRIVAPNLRLFTSNLPPFGKTRHRFGAR